MVLCGWFSAELRKQLQDSVEVSQTWAVAINELVHYEIAIEYVFIAVLNFTGDVVKELSLNLR